QPVSQVRDLQVHLAAPAAAVRGGTAGAAVNNTIRVQQLSQDMHARVRQEATQFREVEQRRRQAESQLAREGGTRGREAANAARTARLDLPRMPAAAQQPG